MRKLYVLPFDHRGSFAKMFGVERGNLTEAEVVALKDYKHLIYEGFLAALKMGVRKEDGAILVDEEFGAKIHEEARAAGITRILTVEKSGQEEFDFECGDKFREHIDRFKPEYVKALARYNPDFDKAANKRQVEKLKRLGDFCVENGHKFLFELLAEPTEEQLRKSGGREGYEKDMQWEVMRASVRELRGFLVEPDIWKLEGLEDERQMELVVREAISDSKKEVGVIVLGRGENEKKVRKWIEVAAKIDGVIGLAVGRTVFSEAVLGFANKKISRAEAAERIAKNYKGFIDIFEAAKKG